MEADATITIKHILYNNNWEEFNMFHSQDGLYFTRDDKGSVTITKTDGKAIAEDRSNVVFEQTVDDGTWCSIVLTMSAFNERPGDWHAWMRHHKGDDDVLVGKRGGY